MRIFSEVNEQLADFRNKRALGLGGLFGDHQLEGMIAWLLVVLLCK